MEKQNSQLEHGQPMEQTRGLLMHMRLRCGSLSITSSQHQYHFWRMSSMFKALHGQVSLAALNQIYVIHEAMNGCKNLKIH